MKGYKCYKSCSLYIWCNTTYLDLFFRQVDHACNFLPYHDIWVVCSVEHSLHQLQLLVRENGSVATPESGSVCSGIVVGCGNVQWCWRRGELVFVTGVVVHFTLEPKVRQWGEFRKLWKKSLNLIINLLYQILTSIDISSNFWGAQKNWFYSLKFIYSNILPYNSWML